MPAIRVIPSASTTTREEGPCSPFNRPLEVGRAHVHPRRVCSMSYCTSFLMSGETVWEKPMAVTVQVLFGTPQHEIASLLRDRLSRCRSVSIVSGFVTVEGIEAIGTPIRTNITPPPLNMNGRPNSS